jgi:hypothetical protein
MQRRTARSRAEPSVGAERRSSRAASTAAAQAAVGATGDKETVSVDPFQLRSHDRQAALLHEGGQTDGGREKFTVVSNIIDCVAISAPGAARETAVIWTLRRCDPPRI